MTARIRDGLIVLVAIPVVGAVVTAVAFDGGGIVAAAVIVAVTATAAGAWARRRTMLGRPAAWGVAAALIALVLAGAALAVDLSDEDPDGCPDGRIYC